MADGYVGRAGANVSGGDGVVFEPGMDVRARRWVVSRPAPIIPLLLSQRTFGAAPVFTKSSQPPRDLIGQVVTLHGGAGLVPIAPIRGDNGTDPASGKPYRPARYTGGSSAAHRAIAQEMLCEPDGWRAALDKIKACSASRLLGEARLVAAFVQGDCTPDADGYVPLRPDKPDTHGKYYLGDWRTWWRERALPLGKWHAPDRKRKKRRWVWCFEALRPYADSRQRPVKGFGGLIWAEEAGLAVRARQEAERQAAEAAAIAPGPTYADAGDACSGEASQSRSPAPDGRDGPGSGLANARKQSVSRGESR